MPAANTGVTGGSTRFGDDYDRDVVVVGMLRLRSVLLLDRDARFSHSRARRSPLSRDGFEAAGPRAAFGSSCLGASVVGDVYNNSGGSLIRRDPAETEQALFARVTQDGRLELVNHPDVSPGANATECSNGSTGVTWLRTPSAIRSPGWLRTRSTRTTSGTWTPIRRLASRHYRSLYPCTCLNLGIGRASKLLRWRPAAAKTPP